ncbi:MAG: sensor histidine kinase [Clostridia bacterium]|nr:sensor histidine kinase [Clostridia bacterium]
MKNRIALKLLLYFAAALAVYAGISGVLFQTLFTRHTMETKRAEMLTRATALAQTLSLTLADSGEGSRQSGAQGAGYGAFVRVLSQLEPNVWVLDEQLQFLSSGHMGNSVLQYADLPEDADTLVQAVFAGETPFSEGFSDLLGTPTLTVGVPIHRGTAVAGALLLHDAVAGIQEAAAQGIRLLAYSGTAALAVAIFLAVLLSYKFARPLNRMKQTAQRLTDGDYTAQTDVRQGDEIGKLAQAIDGLSVRLREAKASDERQEQLRRDFLANVSHELRTPVTVLRGSLEALCDGVAQPGAQTETYHRQMLKETVGLQRLVNDLLDLSRLQNPDFPIEAAPITLNEALGDALYSASQLARPRGITILRNLTEEPVRLRGDYGRLRQMFLIILDNAVKFSPEGGEISVTLTPQSASVRDHGPGISPEELPLIFDRFHKNRTEQNQQGSGLGLSIAREIATRHGIRIEAHSAPGEGSTFTFQWLAASDMISATHAANEKK